MVGISVVGIAVNNRVATIYRAMTRTWPQMRPCMCVRTYYLILFLRTKHAHPRQAVKDNYLSLAHRNTHSCHSKISVQHGVLSLENLHVLCIPRMQKHLVCVDLSIHASQSNYHLVVEEKLHTTKTIIIAYDGRPEKENNNN